MENNNEKVIYRHRIVLRAPKAKTAKTEEKRGEWILLPGSGQKFWVPELKIPKTELPPRKSAAERFEALPSVIEIRKLIERKQPRGKTP
jgi:hypothetical protein